ncbi:hypothetical protein GW932_01540 [archaeon]|nr:hypothetical protein [archaeon]
MNIIKYGGSYFDIGRKIGIDYKRQGMILDRPLEKKIFFTQLKIFKKFYPEYLEELRGIAEGIGCEYQQVLQSFLQRVVLPKKKNEKKRKHCSIFGVKNSKELIVGRNYDWIPEAKKYSKIYFVNNKEANSYFGFSDRGIWKEGKVNESELEVYTVGALNENGLYIGLTWGDPVDFPGKGIGSGVFIKMIAEKCSNVSDAVKLFNKVPLNFSKNYFVVDSEGNMKVLEFNGKKKKVVEPKEDILIKTNHYLNYELSKNDSVLKKKGNSTFLRYYEILKYVEERKDKFKIGDVKNLLCDKNRYVYRQGEKVNTIWTLALDMTKRKYFIYYERNGKIISKELKF